MCCPLLNSSCVILIVAALAEIAVGAMGDTLIAVGAIAVKAIAAAAAKPVIVLLRFTFFIF